MIDEITAEDILNNEVLRQLKQLKHCWISFTETGNQWSARGFLGIPEYFQHENLNILFRSSSHISTITRNYIEEQRQKSLPFVSKPVRLPGCFTAAQREIVVKYVDKIGDVLNVGVSGKFLAEQFDDRLVVVLAQKSEIPLDDLKVTWKATEVVHCSNSDEIDHLSGSEFQSVLLILDRGKHTPANEYILTSVVSRAQYEVGIILICSDQTAVFQLVNKMLSSYLSAKRSDHVVLFEQFISSHNITEWLFPTDTDGNQFMWWEQRIKLHLTEDKERTIECVRRQPVTIQLQIYFAFYDSFNHASEALDPSWKGKISIISRLKLRSRTTFSALFTVILFLNK